jgi:hypothetical protein
MIASMLLGWLWEHGQLPHWDASGGLGVFYAAAALSMINGFVAYRIRKNAIWLLVVVALLSVLGYMGVFYRMCI